MKGIRTGQNDGLAAQDEGEGRDLLSSSRNLSMSRGFLPGGSFGTTTSGCVGWRQYRCRVGGAGEGRTSSSSMSDMALGLVREGPATGGGGGGAASSMSLSGLYPPPPARTKPLPALLCGGPPRPRPAPATGASSSTPNAATNSSYALAASSSADPSIGSAVRSRCSAGQDGAHLRRGPFSRRRPCPSRTATSWARAR